MRSEHLEVVAVEGQRVGDPKRKGQFIGYVRLPPGKTEGASFSIPLKTEGHKVTEAIFYARSKGPVLVPNDRFHRRLLREGKRKQPAALKMARPVADSVKGKGSNKGTV